jgi:hypothetical protein
VVSALGADLNLALLADYCSFAYSASACFRMGMSERTLLG